MESEALMKKSISHLFKAADTVRQSDATDTLKSYYLIRCQKLCWKGNCTIPTPLSKSTRRCCHCCVPYTPQKTTYKTLTIKKKRFIRRLIKKINCNGKLTSFQLKNAEKLMKANKTKDCNSLVSICGVCQKKHKTVVEKPIVLDKPINNNNNTVVQMKKRKKKRKRKDDLVGLNSEFVMLKKKGNSSFSEQKHENVHTSLKKENSNFHKQKNDHIHTSLKSANLRKGATPSKIRKIMDQSQIQNQSPSLKDFLSSLTN